MESSARHLHLLINDLLEYSRVGRTEHRPHWVEATAVVQQACRQLETEIGQCQARVGFEGLPQVYADDTLLVQLFQNLIGNGIKYARDGVRPELQITAAGEEGGWHFAVRDNGIGMEPGETERIFVIFQRLHTAEKYEGTGIGLSICKKIVERHGGRIWAESQPGGGSTFHFTLPGPDSDTAGAA
jgi:signal transduction histidine kinase